MRYRPFLPSRTVDRFRLSESTSRPISQFFGNRAHSIFRQRYGHCEGRTHWLQNSRHLRSTSLPRDHQTLISAIDFCLLFLENLRSFDSSHSHSLPPLPLALTPVPGFSGLRDAHPPANEKPCCQSGCFTPFVLQRSRHWSLCSFLRLFFSAGAKVKEKNQSSKEAQEKTS